MKKHMVLLLHLSDPPRRWDLVTEHQPPHLPQDVYQLHLLHSLMDNRRLRKWQHAIYGFLLMPHAMMNGICLSGFTRSPGSSTLAHARPGLLNPDALGRRRKSEVPPPLAELNNETARFSDENINIGPVSSSTGLYCVNCFVRSW
jgi:hypothetical protein